MNPSIGHFLIWCFNGDGGSSQQDDLTVEANASDSHHLHATLIQPFSGVIYWRFLSTEGFFPNTFISFVFLF